MNKNDIQTIIAFLQRATLTGQEVEAYIKVVNLLSDMLNEVIEDDEI